MGFLAFLGRTPRRRANSHGRTPRTAYRRARLEPLEERTLLSVGPGVDDTELARSVGWDLYDLHRQYEQAGGQISEVPDGVTLDGDRVAVHVTTTQEVAALADQLTAMGMEVTTGAGHLATGWLPIEAVADLPLRGDVVFCARAAYSPSGEGGDFVRPEALDDPLAAVVGASLAATYRRFDSSIAEFTPPYSLPMLGGDSVLIEVRTSDDDLSGVTDRLEAIGMHVSQVDGSVVAGWLPIEGLDDLAGLGGIIWARPWRGAGVQSLGEEASGASAGTEEGAAVVDAASGVLDSPSDDLSEGAGFYEAGWRFDGEYWWHIPGTPFVSYEEPIDGTNLGPGGAKFLASGPPVDKVIVLIPFGGVAPRTTGVVVPPGESVPDTTPDLSLINLRDFISLPEQPVDATNLAPGEAIFLGAGPPPDQLRLLVPLNENAADTTNTDQIQPNGALGLNLQGSGYTVGVWEASDGLIRATHQELQGRVTVVDSGTISQHATHVAGTIGASGLDANAEGMATQVSLRSYTAEDDFAEMRSDAPLMQVSNHSYSYFAGWSVWPAASWAITTTSGSVDVWFEDRTLYSVEDRDFGKYKSSTAELDDVLYDNPELLSVWAAGNDRNDLYNNASWDNTYVAYFSQSPPGGTPTNTPGYWLVANSGQQSAPPGDGNGGTGFDSLPPDQVAKNSLVVGAVNDVTADPYSSGDISIAVFSSYGPTDDGRIKPDVVGNGVELYSSGANADDYYYSASGTSMAAPNVSGTAVLLIEHFEDEFSFAPRSATTKGVIIHTASDAGNVGPDYSYGWGLVNAAAAATFISNAADGGSTVTDSLFETTYSGVAWSQQFQSDGTKPIKVTIAWTDPAGSAHGSGLDETTPALVNDLDLWITGPGGTYYPWTLDPSNPSLAAEQDEANHLDNVEQVWIESPTAGTYTIHLGHTGTITSGSQDFSMFVSGAVVSELVIDADDPGGNGRDNAQDDWFELSRNADALRVEIDGKFWGSMPMAPLQTITVNGSTDKDDTSVYDLGSGFTGQVTINRGGGGDDIARIHDSPGEDNFAAYPDHATMDIENGYSVTANNLPWVVANSANGGDDVAELYDSQGNDQFTAQPDAETWPDTAYLEDEAGSTFHNEARSFRFVHAYSENGGQDDAHLYGDSQARDKYKGWDSVAYLQEYPPDYRYRYYAWAFPEVYGYGYPDQWDVATLYGKEQAADTFEGHPGWAELEGSGYFHRVESFWRMIGQSNGEDGDVATLYDSAANDFFEGRADYGLLYGSDFDIQAWYFAVAEAFAQDRDDDDTADLYPGTVWDATGDWETINQH